MAMIQHVNMQQNILRWWWWEFSVNHSGDLGRMSFTIWGGTQPTATDVISNWASGTSYYNTYLVHYQNIQIARTSSGGYLNILELWQTPPSATAFSGSSTPLTWGIIWPGNYAISGSIPSTSFVIVPVTDTFGNGVLRLSNGSITSGNPYTLEAVWVKVTGGVS